MGQNIETDEEPDELFVLERVSVSKNRDDEGGRQVLRMGSCNINI